jgi:site-specific DNA recombinase
VLARPASNKPLLHPNLAELYRRKVADLAAGLEQPETRKEAFPILRSLVEAILLVPDNGVLRVEVRGELAGILALADSKKTRRGYSRRAGANQVGCGGGI